MSKKSVVFVLLMIALVSLSFLAIAAAPEGPTVLSQVNSSRRTAEAYKTLTALAGNVSQLSIVGSTVTQTWQGYFGNISGLVTLDDASGNTLYDWTLASPEGEIYASNATITFTTGNVLCWNWSKPSSTDYVELDEYETSFGVSADDVDGINETFTVSRTHDSFYVGEQLINGSIAMGGSPEQATTTTGNACPTVYLYNSTDNRSGAGVGYYEEVLLYDETSDTAVYTAIIEETEPIGFNGRHWDFEMLVADDGHNGNTGTTTYYFYVELE